MTASWTARLAAPTADLTVTFAHGQENGPNGPFGRIVLALGGDGHGELEHRSLGRLRRFRFRVDQAVVRDACALLAATDFPAAAALRPLYPDESPYDFEVRDGTEIARVVALRGGSGYAAVARALEAVAAALIGGVWMRMQLPAVAVMDVTEQ